MHYRSAATVGLECCMMCWSCVTPASRLARGRRARLRAGLYHRALLSTPASARARARRSWRGSAPWRPGPTPARHEERAPQRVPARSAKKSARAVDAVPSATKLAMLGTKATKSVQIGPTPVESAPILARSAQAWRARSGRNRRKLRRIGPHLSRHRPNLVRLLPTLAPLPPMLVNSGAIAADVSGRTSCIPKRCGH